MKRNDATKKKRGSGAKGAAGLAPGLRRFLREASLPSQWRGGPWTKESAELWVAADRDFRHLVSVARIATAIDAAGYGDGKTMLKLARALARLSRASGGGR